MTATNVTIQNWIDYSSQLANLSNLSSLPTIATELQTLNSRLSTIITHIDTLETLQNNLKEAVDRLTTATQNLSVPLARISTATEIVSTSTIKLANTLTLIANTASMSYNFTVDNYNEDTYFKSEPVIPEVKIGAIWTGTVTTIYLNTSTHNNFISTGFRIEGSNIDVDTFVTGLSGVTMTINKPTLGSSSRYTTVKFYRT